MSVLRIPGQLTGLLRSMYGLTKNREDKWHHAVDAAIISFIPCCKMGKIMDELQNDPQKFFKAKQALELSENPEESLNLPGKIVAELKNANFQNTKYSRLPIRSFQGGITNSENGAQLTKFVKKEDTKANRGFYKIEQINNIYTAKTSDLRKILLTDGADINVPLCKENDPILYMKLKKITEDFTKFTAKGLIDEESNPFINYIIETNCIEGMLTQDILNNLHKYGVRRDNDEKHPVVIRLRYCNKVNLPFLIEKKSINKKDTTYIGYDSLKMAGTGIFKDRDSGNIYFLPYYKVFIDKKTGEPDTDHPYYKEVYNEFIGENRNVEYYMTVYQDEYLKVTDTKGWYSVNTMANGDTGYHYVFLG